MLFSDDRFLRRVHTANRRTPAIITGYIAGPDALNEGDLFRFLAVGNSLHMAEEIPDADRIRSN